MFEQALAAVYGASSALFALIAATLGRSYRRLGIEELAGAAWGFALLSLSAAFGAAEMLAESPRLAVSLYAGSSSTAAAGLLVIIFSALEARRGARLMVAAPLAIAFSADSVAAALGAVAAATSRGLARAGFALIGLSHVGRALSVYLMPGRDAALVLLASEALRAAAALAMSFYYSGGVLAGSGEEEQG